MGDVEPAEMRDVVPKRAPETENCDIQRAAVHIEDALRGRVTQPQSVAMYWFFYGKLWQLIFFATAIVHNV